MTDDIRDRIERIIDDHVYPCAFGKDLFVDGVDEAAAAIVDEFDIREHEDES